MLFHVRRLRYCFFLRKTKTKKRHHRVGSSCEPNKGPHYSDDFFKPFLKIETIEYDCSVSYYYHQRCRHQPRHDCHDCCGSGQGSHDDEVWPVSFFSISFSLFAVQSSSLAAGDGSSDDSDGDNSGSKPGSKVHRCKDTKQADETKRGWWRFQYTAQRVTVRTRT